MFKKIVSNLSFSPALVSQLGFYAKRLRKEQTTRRLGMIFVALALIVQSIAVVQPPESANASSANDFVLGGLGTGANRSINNFLVPYDNNTNGLRSTMDHFGIGRAEIAAAQFGSFTTGTNRISWGFENRTGATQVEVKDINGSKVRDVWGRPMHIANGPNETIYGWIGHSPTMGWFAIMQVCGNLVTEKWPPEREKPQIPEEPQKPAPTPANIEVSKTATNVTQGNVDATKVTAKAGNNVTFTVNAKNTGGTAKEIELKDNLTDTLEYATLTDRGGGTFDQQTRVLSWPNVTLQPGASVSKTFKVQIKNPVPLVVAAQTSASAGSYDCKIQNTFSGKTVIIPVDCTKPAVIAVSKTAKNVSQGNVNATTTTAKENDKITFTLNIKNTGEAAKEVEIKDNLRDTLEYSTLTDKGGGTFNETTQILSWPNVTLKGGESQTRTFAIQVKSTIPSVAQGVSNEDSYNCVMQNAFQTAGVEIPVNCAPPKVIENIVTELPTTGPTENALFAAIVLAFTTFFFFRSRQLGKEVRLIRRDLNAGTL